MGILFVGLDGEMSSAEIDQGGRLVQIGVAFGFEEEQRFESQIGWDPDDYHADPRSMAVHGIPAEAIHAAPRAPRVDERLAEYCLRHGASRERRRLIAVGWNVGAFDLPFVRQALPETFGLFSRRSADLNAICFALGGVVRVSGSTPNWTGWRRMAKRGAEERLEAAGIVFAPHDAGWDALAALAAFDWIREQMTDRSGRDASA